VQAESAGEVGKIGHCSFPMGLDGNGIPRLTRLILAVGTICVTLVLTSDRNIFPLGKPWHWRCWNICLFCGV